MTSGDAASQMGGARFITAFHATCFHFNPAPKGGYFAFLGQISPEKRPDLAIEIAVRAGAKLRIAAKIDKVDQVYWTNVIKPIDSTPRPMWSSSARSATGRKEICSETRTPCFFQLIGRSHSDW